jgi:DNA-binding MarR family transcriptional regulator
LTAADSEKSKAKAGKTARIGPTPCYCLKLRRINSAVTDYYNLHLAPSGITISQFSLLSKIEAARECSVRELADAAELDRSTLARSLKPLLRQGLVADDKEPGRRNSRLRLGAAGLDTLAKARPVWRKIQENIRRKLGDDGLTALEELAGKVESLAGDR